VQEVAEVPPQLAALEVLRDVVGAEQLHSHDGEDEDDDRQHEAQVSERSHCASDDSDQKVQRRPRLGQFEHPKLRNIISIVVAVVVTIYSLDTA